MLLLTVRLVDWKQLRKKEQTSRVCSKGSQYASRCTDNNFGSRCKLEILQHCQSRARLVFEFAQSPPCALHGETAAAKMSLNRLADIRINTDCVPHCMENSSRKGKPWSCCGSCDLAEQCESIGRDDAWNGLDGDQKKALDIPAYKTCSYFFIKSADGYVFYRTTHLLR